MPAIKAELFSFSISDKGASSADIYFNLSQDNLPLSMPEEMAFYIKHRARHIKGAFLFNPFDEKNKKFSSIMDIPYISIVLKESDDQKVDPALVLALIQKESSFDKNAYSRNGAVGLMQILPSTARWLGLKNPRLLWRPEVNIRYGIKYIRVLAKMFSKRSLSRLEKEDIKKTDIINILAAYNAGPGNVKKYGGVPPFPETRNHVYFTGMYFLQYKDLLLNAPYPFAHRGHPFLLPS